MYEISDKVIMFMTETIQNLKEKLMEKGKRKNFS